MTELVGDRLNRLKGFLIMMHSQRKALEVAGKPKEAANLDGHITSVAKEVDDIEASLPNIIEVSVVEIDQDEPSYWRQRIK